MKQELVVDWMAKDPVTINDQASVLDAYLLLNEHDIRRLPVVNESNILVGILTVGDVRESFHPDQSPHNMPTEDATLADIRVEDIMTPSPITIYETYTIAQAANFMLENKISGLPVVEPGGKLVGMITESDIFRLVVNAWEQEGVFA